MESVFDQVKRLVPIEKFFEETLGCDLRPEGSGRLATVCPWHDEKTPSLKIYEDGSWRCFGACDTGGSVIDAIMKAESFEMPMEAIDWANEHFKLGITVNNAHYKEFKQRVEKATKKFEAGLAELDDPKSRVAALARDMLERRAISAETAQHFKLVPDKQSMRLLIPIAEKGGHLHAWSGRALLDGMPCTKCGEYVKAEDAFRARLDAHAASGAEGFPGDNEVAVRAGQTCPHCQQVALPKVLAGQYPKYRDSTGYAKGQNLYHLSDARKALLEGDDVALLVMEGFADVWSCFEAGHPAAVSYNSSSITPQQAAELVATVNRVNRKRADKKQAACWIGLVPDFDSTGRRKVHDNIKALKTADPTVEVRVLHGVDAFVKDDKPAKDAGDLLEHHGPAALAGLLTDSWWGADEFKIREILTGAWSKNQQIELINDVLASARHTIALDEVVPMLAEAWETPENVVRTFLHSHTARGSAVMDSARIISTIDDAQKAAEEYLKDSFVITTDFESMNETLPGGGFRLGQLMMILGKCLSAHSPVLLEDGSEPSIAELCDRWRGGEELRVVGVDDRTGARTVSTLAGVWATGTKPVWTVTLADGSAITCSAEHEILTDAGWRTLEQIAVLDRIGGRAQQTVKIASLRGATASYEPIASIEFAGEQKTYDLNVDSASVVWIGDQQDRTGRPDHQRSVISGGVVSHNSGTGKTTLILNLLWQFLRRQQLPCIFFSLEQPKAQVYLTVVQIALGLTGKEAEELVRNQDEKLAAVNELFQNLTIVDNVPDDSGAAAPMTPSRVETLIHEINIMRGGDPTVIVAIDHLGIVKAGEQAPRGIQDSDAAAAGWNMEQFFSIAKATKTFFMVLQQLPKEVPPGEEFGYDAGRGASQQTDYCDYIMCIWRPEQKRDLTEEEKVAKAGQYKAAIKKNRHGPPNVIQHLTFDHKKRRIVTESAMGIPAAFLPETEGVEIDFGSQDSIFGGAQVIDAPTPGSPQEAQPVGHVRMREADPGPDSTMPPISEADIPFTPDIPVIVDASEEADQVAAPPQDLPDWYFN